MSALVPLVLFGWLPFVVVIFTLLPPRRAVITAFLIGWLLLPVAKYDLPGFPDYGKGTATNLGVVLGVVLFDASRLSAMRWRWFDLCAAAFCFGPLLSSLSNGLGVYDGYATSQAQFLTWGLPYLIGRAYFADGPGLEELARGLALGGLVYVPLCLWEIRMSPQLHYKVYGIAQHAFDQTMRGGGYRPMVFLYHGLALGLWMAVASVIAVTLWRRARHKTIAMFPPWMAALGLVAVTVLCKSSGATLLMFMALAGLYFTFSRATPKVLVALAVLPFLFVPIRALNLWSGDELVQWIYQYLPDRALSLGYRFDCENLLSEKARQRWLLGWGGWGRSGLFIGEPDSAQPVVTDSLWILVFGRQGALGLAGIVGMLTIPVIAFARACPRNLWRHPRVAPAVALAMCLCMYMLDNLVNNMPNPFFVLIAGGLGAVRFAKPKRAAPHALPQRASAAVASDSPSS